MTERADDTGQPLPTASTVAQSAALSAAALSLLTALAFFLLKVLPSDVDVLARMPSLLGFPLAVTVSVTAAYALFAWLWQRRVLRHPLVSSAGCRGVATFAGRPGFAVQMATLGGGRALPACHMQSADSLIRVSGCFVEPMGAANITKAQVRAETMEVDACPRLTALDFALFRTRQREFSPLRASAVCTEGPWFVVITAECEGELLDFWWARASESDAMAFVVSRLPGVSDE